MDSERYVRKVVEMVVEPVSRIAGRPGAGRRWANCLKLRAQLDDLGWFRSIEERLPVDREGRPLPWLTYASIAFLTPRIQPSMRVFEYGSGNSTLWWSERVAHVTSCEHELAWYEAFKPKVPANVDYHHRALGPSDEYPRLIASYDKAFEIVVIDGRERVKCARNAARALTDDGVIIWDNSERKKYAEGYAHLAEHGFRRIDFTGFGPIGVRSWSTSVFYRRDNCLGI